VHERHQIRKVPMRLEDGYTAEAKDLFGSTYRYQDPSWFPVAGKDWLSRTLETPVLIGAAGGIIEREFFRYAPEFVDDPGGTSLFPGLGCAVYRSPTPAAAAVDQACLVGYRTVLFKSGFFCDEIHLSDSAREGFLDKLAISTAFENEDTRLIRTTGASGDFVLDDRGQAVRDIGGTAISLTSIEPSNYGSFLFRVAPKLATVRSLGIDCDQFVVWDISETTSQLLEALGVPPGRIVGHDTNAVTRFDRLIVPTLRNPDAFLDEESRALFRSFARDSAAPSDQSLIYVSRYSISKGSHSTRQMLNEGELISRLAAIGFAIVEPEELSFPELVQTFSGARMVVGPAGSGMFNVVFCRPGTKIVDIESEPHWVYAHAGLFASCGLRYGIFSGEVDPSDSQTVHRRWHVNVEALIDRVQSFRHAD
jgi:capsular polysaccharide biosynthesis protein